MTMGSVTAGTVLVDRVDYVEKDCYLVLGHAVDLAENDCSCGAEDCFAIVSAIIHQARKFAGASAS